ncbi:hypothetical protein BC938DRAFT_482699 [Jimgerdemannia flammicorona]|uniref:Ubiquitin-like protease family profile domain-containing protein n=1 Tax=Jimgerdemannia flammicorona TaxID=994334 RepID=A0A433QDH8_9FUNG|nr:hypothetical protein BC938DRAFT_482699 [Jimgerdemannia flammicorona]
MEHIRFLVETEKQCRFWKKNIKTLIAKVPHQGNGFDCAIFLLNYANWFLREPEKCLSKIMACLLVIQFTSEFCCVAKPGLFHPHLRIILQTMMNSGEKTGFPEIKSNT